MKRRNEKTLMVIGDERNIPEHVRMLMDRLPPSVTSKKAKKKALRQMIIDNYSSEVLDKSVFNRIENHSMKPSLSTVSGIEPNEPFIKRNNPSKINMSRNEVTQIVKAKQIAKAVYENRVNTFSRDDNSQVIRRGKKVTKNGTRFTDKEIQTAQTKYRHIYNREIDKLTQNNIINDKDGESMLIRKLYESLSVELNRGKGNQRHERDL